MVATIARGCFLVIASAACQVAAADATPSVESYACRALTCSTLIPSRRVDDTATSDCGYRRGNQWWLDYVAGSLAWDSASSEPREPITVALFDDGARIEHPDLRNQVWTNVREAQGRPGVDDDRNGYVDDLHGWDFVDRDGIVSPQGVCLGRASHGTMMASLIAAERNNDGIAAAGAEGARVMVLRIAGCGGRAKDRPNPERIVRALDYATRMGARILSFSAHWAQTTQELDEAFARVADMPSANPAIVIASVPNKGEDVAGFPAAYPFRRIVRAVPIGDRDMISPGTSAAPPGLNLGAPSACVLGASAGQAGYRIEQGSSNSTAILAGLLAGIWSSPGYARFTADEFLAKVVRARMLETPRRSQPDLAGRYPAGVPLADACTLAAKEKTARVCLEPGQPQGPSK